jgi:hypothetical protein
LCSPKIPCGSWLAGESGGSVDIDVGYQTAFAGKPAPTQGGGVMMKMTEHPVMRDNAGKFQE